MAELIWDGKYDALGKRVGPVRVALPFQTVETVNESAQERDRSLFAEETPWRNRLIWGDKKYVLPSLLPEFAGKIDLIYIDPPFNTGGDFSFTASLPSSSDGIDDDVENKRLVTFTKLPSAIEMKAYRDTWGRSIDSYLKWFSETALLLHDLLHERGSLYVHLDTNIGHYAKVILDEVFEPDRFRNEIVWKRTAAHSNAKQGRQLYGSIHDSIYLYTKGPQWTWNQVVVSYGDEYERERFKHQDLDGRRFKDENLTAAKAGGDTAYIWRVKRAKGGRWESDIDDEHFHPQAGYDYLGVPPPDGRYWAYSRENMRAFALQNRLYYTSNGTPRLKQYFDEMSGVSLQSIWADIPPVNSQAGERVGYPTQKPEALLERIIKTSSNEGGLVLDCFCGSGTTAAVAEKLGRRWITCDLGRFAVHTTRKRLLAIPGVKPFEVQNLGRYERSAWQAAEFGDGFAARQEAYHKFILRLFKGETRAGNAWIHGTRKGRLVHVGAVDAPVTLADMRAVAAEARKLVGTGAGAPTELGIDVLFWDLAFEVNEAGVALAKEAGVNLKVYKIPHEVMERKAVDQGDIQFHELAALGVTASAKGRTAKVELTEFLMSLDYVPDEVRKSVTHWSQWIDYWAVDWDARGDAFHNQWQAYRTKNEPKLALSAEHHYDAPGEYRVQVKVIDLLGNDTTKALKVVVK